MDDWRLRSRRVTYVLLVASFLLIGTGLAGVGATLPVAGGLAALGAGLWAVRDTLRTLPTVVGYNLGWYARDSWLAPAVSIPVVLLGLGGPPAELQALGGFVGLVGMGNYFLRPLYLLVGSALWRLLRDA